LLYGLLVTQLEHLAFIRSRGKSLQCRATMLPSRNGYEHNQE